VLQKVRNYYGMGVKVNSGFRHPLVNAKVGGSTTSDHCKGMAADIEIPGIANADLASVDCRQLRVPASNFRILYAGCS
jgi:zinc D-Ala-D-Ala carboxypeptidase